MRTVADSKGPRPVPFRPMAMPIPRKRPCARARRWRSAKSGVIDRLETRRHHLRIVAAVVHDGRPRTRRKPGVVGHLVRRDQIAAANLGAIELEFAGDAVERTLHREVRRRIAGAADRYGRDLVGLGDDDVKIETGQQIGPGQCRRGIGRQIGPARRIGALVVDHAPAHAEQPAFVIEGNLHVPVLVALLDRRKEMLAPVLDPFDRPAEHPAHRGDNDLLRIHQMLAAESAADIRRDDADLVFVQPEQGDEKTAHVM